jgi:hypothetical protein
MAVKMFARLCYYDVILKCIPPERFLVRKSSCRFGSNCYDLWVSNSFAKFQAVFVLLGSARIYQFASRDFF